MIPLVVGEREVTTRGEPAVSRRTLLAAAAVGALGLPILSGCSRGRPLVSGALDIACGESGGTYIRFGRLLADALLDARVCETATALTTNGSVDNLAMLADGQAQLAMSLADTAADAGSDLVAVGRVYQNYLHCFVRADSGIGSADDLRGRVISIGARGSGTSETASRALIALGIVDDAADANLRRISLAPASASLLSGEIDALMWSGGIPVPEIVSIRETAELRLVELADAVAPLNRRHDGVYQRAVIPADVYGLRTDTETLGVSNFLLCRRDLPDPAAAALVDVVVDYARELVPEPSAGVQYLTPSSLIDTSPVPLHPAAANRYVERHG